MHTTIDKHLKHYKTVAETARDLKTSSSAIQYFIELLQIPNSFVTYGKKKIKLIHLDDIEKIKKARNK